MKALGYIIAFFALAGAVVSVLALQVHYSTKTEPCSINAHWDCGIVNHSVFASIGHVPVAAIGIGGYLAIGLLALVRQRYITFLCALAGLGFALRLSFVEAYVLHLWCIYCVTSQTIIAIIAFLSFIWFTAEYIYLKQTHRRV